jgi:hypothetical protein
LIALDKPLDRTIVCPLNILGEIAGWQLSRLQMIPDALAANALPGAGLIGTVTLRFVLLDFTFFHIRFLPAT